MELEMDFHITYAHLHGSGKNLLLTEMKGKSEWFWELFLCTIQ